MGSGGHAGGRGQCVGSGAAWEGYIFMAGLVAAVWAVAVTVVVVRAAAARAVVFLAALG